MTVNLCEPITFGFTRGLHNGCAVDVPVSLEPALTTPDSGASHTGDCKHICAEIVFDRATGTDRVAFEAHGLQCVSGIGPLTEVDTLLPIWSKRGTAKGCDVSPARGVLRGNIVTFTTANFCIIRRSIEDCASSLNPWTNPPPVPGACYVPPPAGLDCVYCGAKWDLDCTITSNEHFEFPLCTSFADAAGAMAARIPIYLPGARITPDAENWDITGDAEPFWAGDYNAAPSEGRDGLVRYYLKALAGGVSPITPTLGDAGRCCTWLCNWVQTAAAGQVWRLFCNEPNQHAVGEPGYPEQNDKRLSLAWYPGNQSLVHFNFAPLQPCFPLDDQFCMTDGGSSHGRHVWSHLDALDRRLTELDWLRISFGDPKTGYCRLSTDQEAHPYAEPEYVAIANDAIWELGRNVDQIGGHTQHASYNSTALNLWSDSRVFGDCGVKPAVGRQTDPGGDPRTVYVTPYGTDVQFPADLVLDRLTMILRVSFEPRNVQMDGEANPVEAGVRLPATIDIWLWLKARLRPGWEGIPCPVSTDDFVIGGCVPESPTHPVVISADDCSQVPLKIHWRGINGPRPWARSTFNHLSYPTNPACCDYLCALDGLIIPGEVRNTADPDGPQPYEGDVVLTLKDDPKTLGCDCG